ncbi:hypothetical protein [Alcanivorax sp.]|uniref:hypothetical protein n=1 Tax=Alcanivorax sp. TaxID=1872427 RepID=UPI000C121407|nr:hypothetical protein [Alcanivorax sp.]PHR65090.1 MAG: hypothetical protein COA55_12160 [Alcanivorax sp.]
MNRFDVVSHHYDTVTLGVEKLEELEALCRTLWMREKGREPTDPHRVALMRCAFSQAGQWCQIFQRDALKLADLVELCRTQNNVCGPAIAEEVGEHKNSVDLLIEVCSQIQALCSELVSDKPDAVVVRLAFDVAEDALCDFESIESEVSRLLDAPKGESEPVAPQAASPIRALVDRVACLYSGKALPNDPTELRITGHDVYLAQQAQAELGGGV